MRTSLPGSPITVPEMYPVSILIRLPRTALSGSLELHAVIGPTTKIADSAIGIHLAPIVILYLTLSVEMSKRQLTTKTGGPIQSWRYLFFRLEVGDDDRLARQVHAQGVNPAVSRIDQSERFQQSKHPIS